MSQKNSYITNNTYPFLMGTTGCSLLSDANGLTGTTGTTGPTGESPIVCLCQHEYCSKTFINVYSVLEQDIYQDMPIAFDTHTTCLGNCFHEDNSSNIWIWEPGFYQITVTVSAIEPSQFSLVLNDNIVIPGATFGSLSGLSVNNMCTIIQIDDSDMDLATEYSQSGMACKLQVVNNTSYIPFITLYGSSCSSQIIQQNTASLTIIRL